MTTRYRSTATHRFYFKTSSTADAASTELCEKYGAKVRIKVSNERGAFELLATLDGPRPGQAQMMEKFQLLADRHRGEYAGLDLGDRDPRRSRE